MKRITSAKPLQTWAGVSLNTGFAMTGFATVLLGCMLPAFASLWHVDDSHLGRLLAAQFAGSAAGALLPGKDFRQSAIQGYIAVSIIAAVLGVAGYLHLATFALQCVLFFFFGLGLGWAMTSTSLLVGTLFRSRRGSALSLLNASWTIGAAVCPFVATQWTHSYSPTSIFLLLCAIFIAVSVSIFLSTWGNREEHFHAEHLAIHSIIWPLAALALLAFLYVGVESSVSGWMITYVRRDAFSLNRFWAPIAASSFWVAVLCGRLLAPVLLLGVSERRLFSGGIVFSLAALVLLIASHDPGFIALAAFLCGFALGPIFPLCISMCLELSNESPHTRFIFALSGFGGAVLPWLTGVASSDTHSLRRALAVPVFALCVMGILELIAQLTQKPRSTRAATLMT